MNIWFIIGIALIVWVIYDLLAGVTWTHRAVYRNHEPFQYWLVTLFWLFVAIATISASLL
jgi:hypothetical protein